jgi:membrane dipeptidase
VAEAIDYISQLTGSCAHVGIGSDFDGGFGADSVPDPLDTVADLSLVGPALRTLGFSAADEQSVLQDNWLRLLHRGLPA